MMTEMERDYAGRIMAWAFERPETRNLSMPQLIQAYWDEQLFKETTVTTDRKSSHIFIESILNKYNIEAEELIAEIMHWCDEEDVYFDELLDVAKGFYLEEIGASNSSEVKYI